MQRRIINDFLFVSNYVYLFDCDGRPPVLLLVEQRETHCARWVYVGMKERWLEFALGRRRRIVLFECHSQLV